MNKSIAVLPFVNMSSSEDAEYFSDGITEEIINALVKIKELKVTSRTSAFFYKKKNIPMTEIGEQLNVSTILEGGVRLSGENIRITAQLIQTKDDFHFWSETWDRKLDDIFKIQDEVALAIAEKTREYVDQIETDEAQESVNSSISSSELYKKGKSNFYKENPSFNFLSNDARDNVSYSGFKTKGTIYSHEQSSKSKMPLGISEESSRKKKALIEAGHVETYRNQILQYMSEESPYLNPDLSLHSLAGLIDIHPNKLSWLLNESLGKNFNEFINHYRIETFKTLAKEPDNANITVIGLAYDSGFNSKTVFNTSFKKETGLTPKQFLKGELRQ